MSGTRARSGPRTLLAIVAAMALVTALAVPVMADETPVYATVDGYHEHDAKANEGDFWEQPGWTCAKQGAPGGETFVLPALPEGTIYTLVVVNAGSDASTEKGPNTLFEFPSAGETVWADANGDGSYNDGDKDISHMILCTGDEPDQEPEERSATVTVIKQADDDLGADFTFKPDVGADFVLSDDESKTFTFDDEDFGEATSIEFGVAEDVLAAEGWELTDIDCGDNPAASVNLPAAAFLATLEDGDAVTCTFFNEMVDDGEEPNEEEPREDQEGGNPTPTPAGELPDTAAGAFTGTPAALVALLMIAALTATAYTRVARQR